MGNASSMSRAYLKEEAQETIRSSAEFSDTTVASADQGPIVGRPIRDTVLRLVRGMNSRFHPLSVVVGSVSPPDSSEYPALAPQP